MLFQIIGQRKAEKKAFEAGIHYFRTHIQGKDQKVSGIPKYYEYYHEYEDFLNRIKGLN